MNGGLREPEGRVRPAGVMDPADLRRVWFRCASRRPEASVRLVCFPPAGSGASFFTGWSRCLPERVEVLSVQYPGREDRVREPCVDEMERLADGIHEAVVAGLDGPLALFGHSMGATVAYEVARRLEARSGLSPAWLFVSAMPAPHRWLGLGCDTRETALLAGMRRLGGTSELVLQHPELAQLALRQLRSDSHLIDAYRHDPGPRLRAPIVSFVGDQDQETSMDEACGWRDLTTATFALKVFRGDHFYLLEQRSALMGELLARL